MTVYSGKLVGDLDWCVCVDRGDGPKILDKEPSLELADHSPDGFSWGYMGSGAAQLALALLFDVTGDRHRSMAAYQDFKDAYVAQWPRDGSWVIDHAEIISWLNENYPLKLFKVQMSNNQELMVRAVDDRRAYEVAEFRYRHSDAVYAVNVEEQSPGVKVFGHVDD